MTTSLSGLLEYENSFSATVECSHIPTKAHIDSSAPLTPYLLDIVTSLPVTKRSEGGAKHPPTYSLEVKNSWICTSTAAYLHVVATKLAQRQTRLYFTSRFMSLEAESIQYVLYGAYKK